MAVSSSPQLIRSTIRFSEVLGILAKYGLADFAARLPGEYVHDALRKVVRHDVRQFSTAERLRLTATELGATYVKLAQILSTRVDLIGPEVAAELAKLQSNVPADPHEVVRTLIETELGHPVDQLFRQFEDTAMASASIGQVHRAWLLDGTPVVVKVQHFGIEERIRNDLDIMLRMAELAEQYWPEMRRYQPIKTAGEFRRTLLAELDFRRELRNMEEFRRRFAAPVAKVPAPFPNLSSQRVLTMERLDGVSLEQPEAVRAAGYDLTDVARRGANVFLDMIFRDGFYHADPHPGNIMVLDGGVIGLLDCGMVGRIDELLREQVEDLLLAAVNQDAAKLCDAVTRVASAPPDLDDDALRAEIDDFVAEYGRQSLDDFNLSGALEDMTAIIRRHQLVLPARMSLLLKTLVMLEGTARQLSPRFSLAELLQPYQALSIRRQLSPQRIARRLSFTYRDWRRLVEMLPREMADILQQVKRGRFEVHLDHRRLETVANRLVAGMVNAALFVGSSWMYASKAPPTIYGCSVLGALGLMLSLFSVFRLWRAMKRDGDIEPKP